MSETREPLAFCSVGRRRLYPCDDSQTDGHSVGQCPSRHSIHGVAWPPAAPTPVRACVRVCACACVHVRAGAVQESQAGCAEELGDQSRFPAPDSEFQELQFCL